MTNLIVDSRPCENQWPPFMEWGYGYGGYEKNENSKANGPAGGMYQSHYIDKFFFIYRTFSTIESHCSVHK